MKGVSVEPMLTIDDINEITKKYLYARPESIIAGLQCAAEMEDAAMFKEIADEAKSRGIDVAKLLRDDIDRHERLWGKSSHGKVFNGGKGMRHPLKTVKVR